MFIPVLRYAKRYLIKCVNQFRANRKRHYFDTFVGAHNISYALNSRSALDKQVRENGILPDYICLTSSLSFPDNAVFLDVGANVGFISIPLAKTLFLRGTVHAFEPDRENANQFKRSMDLNRLTNLSFHECALQDNRNVTQMDLTVRRLFDDDGRENRGISSLLPIKHGSVGSYTVRVSTIDHEVDRLELKTVDLIKIDVEGLEHKVLLGGLKTINQFRPIIVYEHSVVLDELSSSTNSSETFDKLVELGYDQFYIKNEKELVHLEANPKELENINIICFPSEKMV